MKTKYSGKAGIPNCLGSVVVLVLSKLRSSDQLWYQSGGNGRRGARLSQ
jgi:hypothetical protein